MRSTSFVIGSLVLHILVLAVLILGPQKISDWNHSENEVTPVEASISADVSTEAPAATAAATTTVVKPEVTEPIAQETKPQPAAKIVKKTKPAGKKPVQAAAKEVRAEGEVETEKTTATTETADTQSKESDDQQTEAIAKEAAPSIDPAPVAVKDASEAGLGKGGQSKSNAVSFLSLKQSAGNKSPSYPMDARREGRQGTVELLYRVMNDGSVSDIQVARSSGHSDLDDEAVQAISAFHFEPGQEGWARHPVTFKLKSGDASLPTRQEELGAQTE